ncbi:MAG: YegP family protein [Pseudomonadota bacterium]
MAAKFELYKDKGGEFRFRLKAGNGENIGASEGYKGKSSATNGIASVQKNAEHDAQYDIFEGKSGKWFFNLKAANHQVILSSQGYADKKGAENGRDSVKRNAPTARVDDQT